MTIAIIDYKAGNCTSVLNAFASLGVETVVTREADVIAKADRIVFPGVGAAKSAMENLAAFGLTDIVREQALSGKPFLGICLGMQILFEHSEEDGGVNLLNILPGKVKRFPDTPGFKIPEIGWNQVNGDIDYYFVHSYYAEIGPTRQAGQNTRALRSRVPSAKEICSPINSIRRSPARRGWRS